MSRRPSFSEPNLESASLLLARNILEKNRDLKYKKDSDDHITHVSYKDGPDVPFTWIEMKKYGKTNTNFIRTIFNLRLEIVDSIVDFLINKHPGCISTKCTKSASGSTGAQTTLFSDYDISLSGGKSISHIIRIFNSIFKTLFNNPSSIVFDTNIYAYSFMLPRNDTTQSIQSDNWSPVPHVARGTDTRYFILDYDDPSQNEWALRRFYTLAKDWKFSNGYKFPDHIRKWCEENPISTASIDKYIEKASDVEVCFDSKCDIHTEMDRISHMNYYGDETYFSAGAFYHVVGTMLYYNKNSFDEKLTIVNSIRLQQSMIENLGYFLHSFDLFTREEFIKSTKYLQRIYDAVALNTLSLLNEIKSHIRGRTTEEILAKYGDPAIANKKIDAILNIVNSQGFHGIEVDDPIRNAVNKIIDLVFNNAIDIIDYNPLTRSPRSRRNAVTLDTKLSPISRRNPIIPDINTFLPVSPSDLDSTRSDDSTLSGNSTPTLDSSYLSPINSTFSSSSPIKSPIKLPPIGGRRRKSQHKLRRNPRHRTHKK
jgi:hypothetical protein